MKLLNHLRKETEGSETWSVYYRKDEVLGELSARDIIPGIKIKTDGMARTTQLVQEGFVKISE